MVIMERTRFNWITERQEARSAFHASRAYVIRKSNWIFRKGSGLGNLHLLLSVVDLPIFDKNKRGKRMALNTHRFLLDQAVKLERYSSVSCMQADLPSTARQSHH